MNRTLFLALAMMPTLALAQDEPKQDLTQLGLEDLMKVEVTTASKSAQSLSTVPSAIYVITAEDIWRSGAVSIPEALRLAPGVNVSQIDANKWMVSIRGFNSRFADKLLVLVDGQSIYTPLFSGVYWDAHTLPLQEIDHIEVIRGPGGSLWGANAVNGVINIITKHASQTLGGSVSTEVGSDTKVNTGARYGGKFGKDGAFRIYGNWLSQSALDLPSGNAGPDDWESAQAGLRIDTNPKSATRFTFKTDIQSEHLGQQFSVPSLTAPYNLTISSRYPAYGLNSVARWEHDEANGGAQSLQLSYGHIEGWSDAAVSERRDSEVVDYQRQFAKTGRHAFTLGAGFTRSSDKVRSNGVTVVTPASFTENLYSAFVHDTLDIKANLKLLIGSKFEHDPYTGWQVQPNAQLLYTPNEHRTYWYSVSKAVRTPSRADIGVGFDLQTIPGTPPVLLTLVGNPNFHSEEVISNEIGTRFTLKNNTFLDLAAFYNEYRQLRTFEAATPYFSVDHVVQPFTFKNKMSGKTAGLEAALKTKIRPWWSVAASASIFSERLQLDADSTDNLGLYGIDGRGGASRQQFQIHSDMDLGHHIEFDNDLYYVGQLISGNVPAYYKLDTRIGWAPNANTQISLGIRNALSPHRVEAGEALFETVESIPQSVYLRVSVRF